MDSGLPGAGGAGVDRSTRPSCPRRLEWAGKSNESIGSRATPGARWLEESTTGQGYLNSDTERTVRIRSTGDKAYVTIKGITVGATRAEYEYEIPVADADAMIDTLVERPIIEKRRHEIA